MWREVGGVNINDLVTVVTKKISLEAQAGDVSKIKGGGNVFDLYKATLFIKKPNIFCGSTRYCYSFSGLKPEPSATNPVTNLAPLPTASAAVMD